MFGFIKRREHEWRIMRLEENDKTTFEKLDRIEQSLRAQEKVGDKLDRTLDEMKRNREEEEKNKEKNAKNIRDIKNVDSRINRYYLKYDCYCSIADDFWHIREVSAMLFGYSFWACFWFGRCK